MQFQVTLGALFICLQTIGRSAELIYSSGMLYLYIGLPVYQINLDQVYSPKFHPEDQHKRQSQQLRVPTTFQCHKSSPQKKVSKRG